MKLKLDRTRLAARPTPNYETSVKDIFAAGDIIGPPWLAHVASYEAIQAVEGMFKPAQAEESPTFPGCTYCQPQVASIGLTERAAKEKRLKFKVGKFPFKPAARRSRSARARDL